MFWLSGLHFKPGHHKTLLEILATPEEHFTADSLVETPHGRCSVEGCSFTFESRTDAERRQKHGIENCWLVFGNYFWIFSAHGMSTKDATAPEGYACTFNIEGNIQCGIRFPTKGLLQKHKRDEGHILKRVQPNQDVNANVWANNNFILVLVVTVQHMFNWSLSKDRPTSPIKLCKSAKFIVFFLTEYHFIRGKIRPNILVVSSASHKIGIAIKYTRGMSTCTWVWSTRTTLNLLKKP